jgi:FixJ family two-component response regulator
MAFNPKRAVAVVDDDFRVRESIQSLVESAGYTALVFPLAQAFLQSGALAEAACLITDVRMPGMDGLELQQNIIQDRPDLPVIFISAHPDENVRQRALKHGAIGFLQKPFSPVELLQTIEAALAKSS